MLHAACGKDMFGIRGRISHIQVDPHSWEVFFVSEEPVYMFKAMPEIILAQLQFVWDFFSEIFLVV